jgi:protein-S-isoprenylcysteine O-methyltransferase Ste14
MNQAYSKKLRIFAALLVFIQFSSLGAITLLALIDFSTSYWPINIGLIVISGYLVVSAYKSLKPSLSVNPIPRDGAAFIRSGIYRNMRHPMYAAVILLGFGLSGFSASPAAIVICGILIINIVVKAKVEDNLLLKRHPEIWEYQLSTPGFIPCRCR